MVSKRVVERIVQDVQDGKESVEVLQEALQAGKLEDLREEVEEALAIVQQRKQQQS